MSDSNANTILEKIKEILTADSRVRLGLVFGSLAQGKFNSSSDVDLGVAFDGPLSIEERVNLAQHISAAIGREVDLVDLRTVEGILLQQILDHRKRVVNRDNALLGNLISKRVVEASDLMPLINEMLKKRRERFIRGS